MYTLKKYPVQTLHIRSIFSNVNVHTRLFYLVFVTQCQNS